MTLARSPLAPATIPDDLPPVRGVQIASAAIGLRYKDRPDVLLAVCGERTVAAGVFTQSTTLAAPVIWCRDCLQTHAPRALLVNAGQANSFVGRQADELIHYCTETLAGLIGVTQHEVLVASTGVIGQPVPQDKLVSALPDVHRRLQAQGWREAAHAITTTDTFVKLASRTVQLDGKQVTINGIAKGSGMIAPNMATMLAFIFTDAAITKEALAQLLREANAKSFNCISVDGDCSTNDTVLAFATGQADNETIEQPLSPHAHDFRLAFESLMLELAQAIVRDGEGARKFITVHVSGAEHDRAAHRMAMDIVNSPLVKTAIAGEDPNWGRIVMAVGKSGEAVNTDALSIAFGEHIIARGGAAIPHFDETPVKAYMQQDTIDITVEVGHGVGEAKVWGCDLTKDYISINADYRS